MTMGRWFILIGIVMGLGFAKVSQQSAIWLAALELGRQYEKLHALENDTQRLATQVTSLESPAHLLSVMNEQGRGRLVAWSALPPTVQAGQLAQLDPHASHEPRID